MNKNCIERASGGDLPLPRRCQLADQTASLAVSLSQGGNDEAVLSIEEEERGLLLMRIGDYHHFSQQHLSRFVPL